MLKAYEIYVDISKSLLFTQLVVSNTICHENCIKIETNANEEIQMVFTEVRRNTNCLYIGN